MPLSCDAPTCDLTNETVEPTAIWQEETATPNLFFKGSKPIIENVIYIIRGLSKKFLSMENIVFNKTSIPLAH